MLNEQSFRDMFKVPHIDKVTKKIKLKLHKPKSKTVYIIMSVISKNRHINRKGIIELSEISENCVDKCIDYLLENKLLERKAIFKAGGYITYTYTVA